MCYDESLSTPKKSHASRNAKIAALLTAIVCLALAHRLGLLEQFRDPARAKQTLVDLGTWGYVAFVAAYATLQPFGIPGTVFVLAATLVWPWPIAFVVSMIGTMAASVVGFSFARFVARAWITTLVPVRFHKYDDELAKRAFVTVFFMRLIFWMPPLLHAFFGVSKVRFSTHFWGSLAGYVVPLLLMSFFGQRLFEALKNAPPTVWLSIGIGVFVVVLSAWLVRRQAAKCPNGDPPQPEDGIHR